MSQNASDAPLRGCARGEPVPDHRSLGTGLVAWTTALAEFGGGLAIIAGAFVAGVSISLIVIMLVAMFAIQLPYGFSAIKLMGMPASGPQFGTPGYEAHGFFGFLGPARVFWGQAWPALSS